MALASAFFQGDPPLEACLTNDSAHLTRGASGNHVAKVQFALFAIDGLGIDDGELANKSYGESTAAAVLAYKTRRSIINPAYQSTPDDIVGKMTIASLDQDMLSKQGQPGPPQSTVCGSDQPRPFRPPSSAPPSFAPVRAGGPSLSLNFSVAGAPSAQPHEIALSRVGAAAAAIAQTRAVLAGLISFRPVGQPVLPPGTMANFDKVWRNFGPLKPPFPIKSEGEFPDINTLADFLRAIDSHYAHMQGVLAQAPKLFGTWSQDLLGPNVFAWTLVQPRVPGDPPGWPDGIYFGDVFARSNPNRQVEVVIHEPSHFKVGHNFQDVFAFSKSGWGKFDGSQTILNAWSYSMFVLDVAFNRTTPFPA
jgi:hypothetical protein